MMYYVYWKSAHARLDGGVPDVGQTVEAALAETGFRVTGPLAAERTNGLPGLPFVYTWSAAVERAPAGQSRVTVEYGLRADAGTWIALALAVASIFPLVWLSDMAPELTMIPMIPVVWLFAAVIAMKIRQGQLERRLWQAIGQRTSVTGFETSVRAVS